MGSSSVLPTALSVVGNAGNGLWRCNSLVDAPGSMQCANFVACVVAPGALRWEVGGAGGEVRAWWYRTRR